MTLVLTIILGLPLLVAGVFLAGFVINRYNRFVVLNNQVHNVYATIDVLLKKRFDLLPNMIRVVEKYAQHEQETLAAVTALRSQSQAAHGEDETIDLNNRLTRQLNHVMGLAEAYPDLKADEHFLHLQATLVELENWQVERG